MNQKNKQTIKKEEKSFVSMVMIMLCMAYFVIAPFQKGLFNGGGPTFQGPLYAWFIVVSIILILLSIRLLRHNRFGDQRDILKILVLCLPIVYMLSLAFTGISVFQGWNSVAIHWMYAVFFLVGLYISKRERDYKLLQDGVILSGYVLVIMGLAMWFGNYSYPDGVLVEQNRLAGVFQYPNTYGGFLVGLLFASLFTILRSKRLLGLVGHSVMLAPILLSLLLTMSRGALLLVFAVFFLSLFLMSSSKQLYAIFLLGAAGMSALLIMEKVRALGTLLRSGGTVEEFHTGWVYIAAASLFVVAVAFIIYKYKPLQLWDRKAERSLKHHFFLPAGLAGMIIILMAIFIYTDLLDVFLPASVLERIESINLSANGFVTRGEYYADALRIIQESPLLGYGGNGWGYIYESFKSYPYSSRQAHNSILQYAVEAGLLGLLVLSSIIGIVVWRFAKLRLRSGYLSYVYGEEDRHQIFFIFIAAVLLHSLMDFDMSYVYIGTLVFLGLGAISGDLKASVQVQGSRQVPVPMTMKNRILPIALAISAVIVLIWSTRMYSGHVAFQNAIVQLRTSGNFAIIDKELSTAIAMSPTNPDYAALKANLYNNVFQQTQNESYFTEGIRSAERLKANEPYHIALMDAEINLLASRGPTEDLVPLIEDSIQKYPWLISQYEKLIGNYFGLGSNAGDNHGKQEMYWGEALNHYNDIIDKRRWLNSLPDYKKFIPQAKSFTVTPDIALRVGLIHFVWGDFEKASIVFNIGLVEKDFSEMFYREMARYYLASLQLQGKEDVELLRELIRADGSEQEKLDSLIASKRG